MIEAVKPKALSRRGLIRAGGLAMLASGCRSIAGHGIFLDPTTISVDSRRYRFIETSESWKQTCSVLPSFAALAWYGYATKVIEDRIDGQDVVIQLWKGLCPQFANLAFMPGGVGAEVGIYRRIPGKQMPTDVSGFPAVASRVIGEALKHESDELFWPYPELGTTIEFDFINPDTGEVVFHADPQTTYWRNRWMDAGSYEQYFDAQPGNWPFNKKAPLRGWSYTLRYTINGRKYDDWTDHG